MPANYCPILCRLPHRDDCRYCGNYNYLTQVCQHEDVALVPNLQALGTGGPAPINLQPIRAELNYLTNKLNAHLDKNTANKNKPDFKGIAD